jgi:aldehyde dehydrogenase (NAD+)/betaine-aldehyde dehydrogenase
VRHPGVEKVAFTGSTTTGAEIMRLASDGIKRLILELGGKSPNLGLRRREPRRRDPELGLVDLLLAGQSCEARSRVLVERSIYDDFVARSPRPPRASRSATRSTRRPRSAR